MAALGARPRQFEVRALRAANWRTASALTALFVGVVLAILLFERLGLDIGTDRGLAAALALTAAFGALTGFIAYRAGGRAAGFAAFAPEMLELMTVGVVMTDAEYKVTFANRAFARMLGRTQASLVGAPMASLVLSDDLPVFDREAARGRGGAGELYSIRFVGAGGRPVSVLVSAASFEREGRFDGTFAVLHDITESYAAREEADRARTLSSFLFDMFVHDLSNSMQAYVGQAEIAAALGAKRDANAFAVVRKASAAAERSGKLLRDIKQVAEAERTRWATRSVPLSTLIQRAFDDAELTPLSYVMTEWAPELAGASVEAGEAAHLALSKLLEEASGRSQGDIDPRRITLEICQGALGESTAVVCVHGCPRSIPPRTSPRRSPPQRKRWPRRSWRARACGCCLQAPWRARTGGRCAPALPRGARAPPSWSRCPAACPGRLRAPPAVRATGDRPAAPRARRAFATASADGSSLTWGARPASTPRACPRPCRRPSPRPSPCGSS